MAIRSKMVALQWTATRHPTTYHLPQRTRQAVAVTTTQPDPARKHRTIFTRKTRADPLRHILVLAIHFRACPPIANRYLCRVLPPCDIRHLANQQNPLGSCRLNRKLRQFMVIALSRSRGIRNDQTFDLLRILHDRLPQSPKSHMHLTLPPLQAMAHPARCTLP